MSWESQVLALLTASVARPFVLVAVAWLMLRVLRVPHPASRHAVWTAVLIGIVLLPFVSVFAPHWMLPVLPPTREAAPSAIEVTGIRHLDTQQSVHANPSPRVFEWPSAQTVLIWGYLVGFLTMVMYRVAGWVLLKRVISRSVRVRTKLRESRDVLAPVAVGVLRPIVILPAGWRDWNTNTKRAVLAHEYEHLRRHDTVVSALAGWIRCALWFHPLVWWVSRKVSECAELACDAAALERVGDPASYSRMLLGFAADVNRAGRRVTLPGLAMSAGSGMDRRIDFAFELSGANMRNLSRPGLLLLLAGVPILCLTATLGMAQQESDSPASTARFEVASVRPTEAQARGQRGVTMHGGPGTSDPTRIEWTNVSVTLILRNALHAYLFQIVRPASADSQSYDIGATLPPGTTKEQFDQMLVNLLEERFHLALHRETREFPGFELVLGKNGAKLREVAMTSLGDADPTSSDASVPPKTDANGFPMVDRPGVAIAMKMKPGAKVPSVYLTARAQALAELVHMLGEQLGRPVVDKTGLTGKYDYTLEFPAMESPDGQDEAGPSILTAVQEQLGLKLESKRVPLDMVIVDHSDKIPSGN